MIFYRDYVSPMFTKLSILIIKVNKFE